MASVTCLISPALYRVFITTILSPWGCVAAGMAPCDILLLLSSSEGDAPKVAELLAAGAHTEVKVSRLSLLKVLQISVLKECMHSLQKPPVARLSLLDRCQVSSDERALSHMIVTQYDHIIVSWSAVNMGSGFIWACLLLSFVHCMHILTWTGGLPWGLQLTAEQQSIDV